MNVLVYFWTVLNIYIFNVSSQCTFPSHLQGEWLRSRDVKTLSFESPTTVTGFNLESKKQVVDEFNCFINEGTKYVLRSERYDNILPDTYIYIYTCYDMVPVGAKAFYVYELTQKTSEITNDERGAVYSDKLTVTLADICSLTRNDVQYTTLVSKAGLASNDVAYCPDILLGSFNYTQQSQTSLCTGISNLTACYDRVSINSLSTNNCTGDYFGYSATGYLLCTANLQFSTVTYVTLYNTDLNVDNSNTYRFSCLAIERNGDQLLMTQYPTDCELGQSGTSVSAPGFKFTLDPQVLCPIPDPTTPINPPVDGVDGGDDIGMIVGVLIGVIICMAVILVIILCIRSRKRKRARVQDSEEGTDQIDKVQRHQNGIKPQDRSQVNSAASTTGVVIQQSTGNLNSSYKDKDNARRPSKQGDIVIGTKRFVKPPEVGHRLSLEGNEDYKFAENTRGDHGQMSDIHPANGKDMSAANLDKGRGNKSKDIENNLASLTDNKNTLVGERKNGVVQFSQGSSKQQDSNRNVHGQTQIGNDSTTKADIQSNNVGNGSIVDHTKSGTNFKDNKINGEGNQISTGDVIGGISSDAHVITGNVNSHSEIEQSSKMKQIKEKEGRNHSNAKIYEDDKSNSSSRVTSSKSNKVHGVKSMQDNSTNGGHGKEGENGQSSTVKSDGEISGLKNFKNNSHQINQTDNADKSIGKDALADMPGEKQVIDTNGVISGSTLDGKKFHNEKESERKMSSEKNIDASKKKAKKRVKHKSKENKGENVQETGDEPRDKSIESDKDKTKNSSFIKRSVSDDDLGSSQYPSDLFLSTAFDADALSISGEETIARKSSVISSVGPASCALKSPRDGPTKKTSVASIPEEQPEKSKKNKKKDKRDKSKSKKKKK